MAKKIDALIKKIICGFHIYSDIALGSILTLASIALYINASHLKISAHSVTALDSAQFVPKLAFGLITILSILVFIQGLKKVKDNKETCPRDEKLEAAVVGFKRTVIAVLSIGVFIFLMTRISFMIAAIMYLIFNMYFMVERRGWKHKTYFTVAIVVSVSCFYLFDKYIYVTLPLGFLKGVFG